MNIKEELDDLYERWLLEEYPDEIGCKDHFVDLICDGYRYDDFMSVVRKEL